MRTAASSTAGRQTAYQSFAETEQQYRERLNLLTSLAKSARQRPPSNYEFFISWSGDWIDKNPPPHITNADGLRYGMSIGAERFYTVGSSFVHGYKWMTAYIGTEEDVLAQLADSLAAALIMTECAVALYEAQATHPARSLVRRKNYPDYLEPTVAEWRRYCHQDLWMGVFQATSVSCDSSGSAGVMSMGRSRSFPLWKTAPLRTRATRCGALTARQRVCAASISL